MEDLPRYPALVLGAKKEQYLHKSVFKKEKTLEMPSYTFVRCANVKFVVRCSKIALPLQWGWGAEADTEPATARRIWHVLLTDMQI